MNRLPKYVSKNEKTTRALEIAKKLQKLRELGKTDEELTEIIADLNLPLGIHLFVMGNFSALMENRIIQRMD